MLSKYGKDSSVTQMVDKLDWVIMPVFNVDGYVFTQQVIRLKSHSYQTLNMFRAIFTWLSKGIGFGFGFGFTAPFGWLVYLLWFWFYDSQVKNALKGV